MSTAAEGTKAAWPAAPGRRFVHPAVKLRRNADRADRAIVAAEDVAGGQVVLWEEPLMLTLKDAAVGVDRDTVREKRNDAKSAFYPRCASPRQPVPCP